jgi:hypothetical protein
MNHAPILSFVFVGTSLLAGCATAVDRQGSPEKVSASTQSVTLADCATQRDACLANNPLFGVFVCPAQYTQCTLTASNGLPAQVNQAVTDAAACASTARRCAVEARTAAQRVSCATTQAECIASILQINLPSVVTGTATCVTDSIACINNAEQVSDLTTCANNLQSCAVTQVQTVVPPAVGKVIGSVSSCQTTLSSCIAAAATPADVTTCSLNDATCVVGSFGLTPPNSTASAVIKCTDDAANCALQATTQGMLDLCRRRLTGCVSELVGPTTPPPMTCAQKWTACLAANPLNFATCDAQLLTCTQ